MKLQSIVIVSALLMSVTTALALADGQTFKKSVGAFGKGGPRNTSDTPPSLVCHDNHSVMSPAVVERVPD